MVRNLLKILYVYFLFYPNVGGTEIPMYYYAKELASRGHHIIVFTANTVKFTRANLNTSDYVSGIHINRFSFIPFPLKYFFFAPSMMYELLNVDIDIIKVYSMLPSFFVILPIIISKLRKIPLVLYPQYHPLRSSLYKKKEQKILGLFFDRVVSKFLLKFSDCIIALSRQEAKYYTKMGLKNVHLVYEGISLPSRNSENNMNDFSHKYGLTQTDKVVLLVGRIEERKGFHLIINILPSLLKKYPDIKLMIVGEDFGYKRYCVNLIRSINCFEHVIFTGRISSEELSCAYERSDIVVIPSLFEAYGRVVVEAWSYQKPVIVSRMVPLHTVVNDIDGGLVYSNGSFSLEQAILKLLANTRLHERYGKNGYNFIQKLSWNKRALKLESIYEHTINLSSS